ncbi:hypothetical protein [Bacillus marasmi]|uniref:hypothetical protein n=1 Tax=Bacillus marasmi TaxID=1926279 RepID=UPI0011C90C16|nr:hypothetical protein [Bacillus marasmi]
MAKLFEVVVNGNDITIQLKYTNVRVNQISVFIDHHYLGSLGLLQSFVIQTNGYLPKKIQIQYEVVYEGRVLRHNETHHVRQNAFRKQQYKPGDILVSCDNVNGLPFGFMGHGALVISDQEAIESIPLDPIVRKITIESFKSDHPNHAQFRPVSEAKGLNAANYAIRYLNIYQENKIKGIKKPKFKFTIKTPLHDEWTYIYCTKLIWLSYYYGAGIEFINDHLWFSPEDVYSNCINHPEFELIYIHPEFKFHIDS